MNQIENLNPDEAEILKRPKLITILCWIIFILIPINAIISIFMFADDKGISKYGIEESDIVNAIIISIPIFIGAIGLYKMKKWGAWIFIGAQVIGVLMSFSISSRMHESPIIGLISSVIYITIVLYYYKNLSGNDFPLFNSSTNPVTVNTNTFTDAQVSNNISKENNTIEEIEKLFQMKEKGIISDEDFKLMKEKIINSN